VAAVRRVVGSAWYVVAPALFVTAPLAGSSLQYDEIKLVARTAYEIRANPLRAAHDSYEVTDHFLSRGNFRPIGRFLENLYYSAVYETAEATSLAPHAVQGLVRLALLSVLAFVATQIVWALMRSAGADRRSPALLVYPMVFAAVLVAGGSGSPIVLFPLLFIGAAVLVLAIALAVARDFDMQIRPLLPIERGAVGLLGAAAAMVYDLVYVAPGVAAAFIASRAVASHMRPRELVKTAAVKRWSYLLLGFLAVFVPTRLEIASRCSQRACYDGTDIEPSSEVLVLLPARVISGAPPAGWRYVADRFSPGGQLDALDLASNSLLALLAIAVVAVAVVVSTRACRAVGIDGRGTAWSSDGSPSWLRLAGGVALVGATMAVLPALLASFSRWLQQDRPAVGEAWRETLMVQVGWSFLLFAACATVVGAVASRGARRIVLSATGVLVAAGMVLTLYSNWTVAVSQTRNPVTSITRQVLAETMSGDAAGEANARRCHLMDAYERAADPPFPASEIFDDLMLDRFGYPFCDHDR